MLLQFPPLLGGDGGPATYLVLALILVAVAAVFIVVYRLFKDQTLE